jgi:hypothetical protein
VNHLSIPKFGIGSNSCEGNEKRTVAISVTPINLEKGELSASSSDPPSVSPLFKDQAIYSDSLCKRDLSLGA